MGGDFSQNAAKGTLCTVVCDPTSAAWLHCCLVAMQDLVQRHAWAIQQFYLATLWSSLGAASAQRSP